MSKTSSLNDGWPTKVSSKDLKIEYYKSGGPGGQHKNKNQTACRITHIPTNISAQAEEQRSQRQNLRKAFDRLSRKLVPLMREAIQQQTELKIYTKDGIVTTTPEQLTQQSTKYRIRTYDQSSNQVKDHRITSETWRYDDVLDKNKLDQIIEVINKEKV